MQAFARVAVESVGRTGGRARNRIAVLRSEPPLMFRPIVAPDSNRFMRWDRAESRPATVTLVAGSAGPIGGDRFRLEIEVRPGSTLLLSEVAATLLLPGPNGEESLMEVDIRVGASGTLVWLPEPVIAARGCRHRTDIRITLDAGARLLLREEIVLGRHGEPSGMLRQHVRAQRDGRPLLDQELAVGSEAMGWDGAAVTGDHHVLGSVLAVDPTWQGTSRMSPSLEEDAAILQLPGPAVLINALAADTLALRRQLETGLARVDQWLAQSRCDQGDRGLDKLNERVPNGPPFKPRAETWADTMAELPSGIDPQ